MNLPYWGWLNRNAEFIYIDDRAEGHHGYCDARGLEEKKDFDDKGFVKVNQSASNIGMSYWYTCHYKMTLAQANWLRDNGIEIPDKDVAYN